MSRLLTILLITCLMATAVMGLTASQQRLRARTAMQHQSSSDSDLAAATSLDTTHDMESTSNIHMDADADIDADVDADLDAYVDSESDMSDMTEEAAFLEAETEMDQHADSDSEAEAEGEAEAEADAEADIFNDMDADAFTEEQELADQQMDEQSHDQSHEQVQVEMDASHDASSMAALEAYTETDTSLLESQSSVSYIAFGDKGLQGSNTEYGVIVNKQPCGVAVGVTGGLRYYDIIETTDPKTGIQKKKFGQRNFATINVAFDRPNAVLTSWIKDTLDGKYSLRNGAVQADDGRGNLKASLSFDKAYISKITFPKFDLTDDRPAIWKIAISPQMTHLNQAEDGAKSGFRDQTKKFKPFGNNFRLYIDNKLLKGVRIIESFQVETRRADPTNDIKPLYKVGNLVFEVSQAEAGDLFFWMEKQHTKKKDGTITVYKPSGKVFYSIALKGMGVYKVHPLRAAPRQIRWLRVEIFCEQVSFVFDPKPAKAKASADDAAAEVVEEKTESITVIDDIPDIPA